MSVETETYRSSADNTVSDANHAGIIRTKRNAGIGLIAASVIVVFVTAYLMWVKAAFVADPRHHAERIRPYWMFAGLVVMLACNMFLAGIVLLQSSREDGGRTNKNRSLAPVLYLTGSVNIGLLAAFIEMTRFQPAGFLAYFLCLPTIIFRMFKGPIAALINSNTVIAYTAIILFYVIFYVCFFYPLYKRRYAFMGIIGAIILGIGFLILVVAMTLYSME